MENTAEITSGTIQTIIDRLRQVWDLRNPYALSIDEAISSSERLPDDFLHDWSSAPVDVLLEGENSSWDSYFWDGGDEWLNNSAGEQEYDPSFWGEEA